MAFWSRIESSVSRWLGRAPRPGGYVEGAAFPWRGWLGVNPAIWPRRHYLPCVPKGASRFRPMPIVVLLHGCRQTPEEIARGARIAPLADRLGSYVPIPRQKESANPYRCWNGFDGAVAARLVEVDDLGHAWRGGDPTLPFNDAALPDATAMAGAFLDLVRARAPA